MRSKEERPKSEVQSLTSGDHPGFGLWTWNFGRYTSQPMSEQDGQATKTTAVNSDLFDPYERLVSIEILGQRVEVPEKNRLLRCFQFLSLDTISYGDFCWNGDCTNCQIWYHVGGQSRENDKPGLACRMDVIESMVITSMSRFIKLDGITK